MVTILMIACIIDNNGKITGFRLFDVNTHDVMDVASDLLKKVLISRKARVLNIDLDASNNIKAYNGSFDRYTRIKNKAIINGERVVIAYEIPNVGYGVVKSNGKLLNLKRQDVIKLANKYGIANGKLVNADSENAFISPIAGEYPKKNLAIKEVDKDTENKKDTKSKSVVKVNNLEEVDIVSKINSKYRINGNPVLPQNSLLKTFDEVSKMTVEQKILRGLLVVKSIAPFYFAILSILNHVESTEISTCAVTLRTLYYNSTFILSCDVEDIPFILIHEASHIMDRHHIRMGIRSKELWNIACDLYINRVIAHDFCKGINPGEKCKYDGTTLGFPAYILYDETVSIENDTPESIYAEMEKDARNQGAPNNSASGSGGNEDTENNQGGSSGGQNSQSGNQSGQGNEQNNQNGSNSGGQSGQDNKGNGNSRKVYFRNKEFEISNNADLIEDSETAGMSDNMKNDIAKSTIRKADVLRKKSTWGNAKGTKTTFEIKAEEALVPKINWRNLLLNRLQMIISDEKSYSHPDKRFVNRNLYLEGSYKEEKYLEGVKICLDTSGSISDRDIGVAFKQIDSLLSTYPLEAELIYWDTEVESTCDFRNRAGFDTAKTKVAGRGGTDANCLFEYFNTNKEYRTGKKAYPEIVLIFTDGEFPEIDSKYNKYSKKVVWILSDYNCYNHFEPKIGKKALLKFDDI